LQQNEVAERKKISLEEMAIWMLHARSLLPNIWAGELNCLNHIHKKPPHISFKDQTPLEAWSGKKPEVTHF